MNIIRCNLCDQPEDMDDYIPYLSIPKIMAQHNLCFRCAYWMDRKEIDKNPDIIPIISQGSHYTVNKLDLITGQNLEELYSEITVILTYDGLLFGSNRVTHQGTIPKHFKDWFPDNALILDNNLAKMKALAMCKKFGQIIPKEKIKEFL